jgi:hypothetical protein
MSFNIYAFDFADISRIWLSEEVPLTDSLSSFQGELCHVGQTSREYVGIDYQC